MFIVCVALHVLLSSALSFMIPSNSPRRKSFASSTTSDDLCKLSRTVMGPPPETKPDYETIHGPLGRLADKVFMAVFRIQMANKVGIDSKLPKDDYMGLMELTTAMNARYSDRRQVQSIAQDVLSESSRMCCVHMYVIVRWSVWSLQYHVNTLSQDHCSHPGCHLNIRFFSPNLFQRYDVLVVCNDRDKRC